MSLQDAVLVAEMAPALLGADNGQAHVAAVLGLGAASLDSMPLNMSLLSPEQLLLRGYYLNRSAATGGQDGLESFLDVTLTWGPAHAGGSKAGPPLAAIVAPVVVAGLLLLGLGGWLALRCLRRRRAAAGCGAAGKSGKGELPRVHADASSGAANGMLRLSSDPSVRSSAIGVGVASVEGDGSNRGNSTLSSRVRSGPSADIAQACQSLVLHKTNGDQPDELVLQSVLGEGSYGKVRVCACMRAMVSMHAILSVLAVLAVTVASLHPSQPVFECLHTLLCTPSSQVFKATWRGTVVAVKISESWRCSASPCVHAPAAAMHGCAHTC